MKKNLGHVLALACLLTLSICFNAFASYPSEVSMKSKYLKKGLTLTEFSRGKEKEIICVIVDPNFFSLKLMTASNLDLKENLSAKQWVEKFKLTGAVNAGMYQKDHRTSVGMLISPGHVNNPRLGRDKTVLVFDPIEKDIPRIQIVDRTCQNFNEIKPQYRSFLQSIRMLSCKQKNTWKKGGEKWSTTAIAMNKHKEIVLVFGKIPLTPHDLISRVSALPLDLQNMMYLEGGPPAQLYFKVGKNEIDLTGKPVKANSENDLPVRLAIPNVLAIVPRK